MTLTKFSPLYLNGQWHAVLPDGSKVVFDKEEDHIKLKWECFRRVHEAWEERAWRHWQPEENHTYPDLELTIEIVTDFKGNKCKDADCEISGCKNSPCRDFRAFARIVLQPEERNESQEDLWREFGKELKNESNVESFPYISSKFILTRRQ